MRNIAIHLVLQQCCKVVRFFCCCCPFSVSLHAVEESKDVHIVIQMMTVVLRK